MKQLPVLHAVGTALPARVLQQNDMMEAVLASAPPGKRLYSVINLMYRHSGIETRHTVIPDFYRTNGSPPFIPESAVECDGPATAYRNELFAKEAPVLSIGAVRDLFFQLPYLQYGDITHLVTVSCTGFSAPGFDLALIKALGFSGQIERFHIGFMGCHGVFPALRLANAICLSDNSAKVVIVSTELCSLHYRHRFDTQTIISNSLFADGSAAALVSSDLSDGNGCGLILNSFAADFFSGTDDDMSWIIGNHGFEMTLSPNVPYIIEQNINSLLERTSLKAGVNRGQVSNFAIHPGGRAILEHAAKALAADSPAMESSYAILKDCGNMSSATILFVLGHLLKRRPKGYLFAASFGPGLTAESAIMEAF